eukprot:gene326-349_t
MAAAPIVGYRRKRERSAIESGVVTVQDEDYIRNKRLLRESLKVMTLAEQREKPSSLANAAGTVGTSSSVVLSDNNIAADVNTINDDQSVCSNSEFSRLNSLETVNTIISEEESEDERSRSHRSQHHHYHQPQQQQQQQYMSGGIAEGDGIADPTTFIATFKGGRKQYVRKVDYLVDELIRKTRRTLQQQPNSLGQEECSIPNVIGPHPAVDHALSLLLPPLPPCDFQSIEQSQAGAGLDMHGRNQDGENHKQHRPTHLYSGNVTHGDWEIEEISDPGSDRPAAPLPSELGSPSCSSSADMSDATEESDMACCDDYHPSICDSPSISSMESEEERSHTMEMCSDDKYFNVSSNVQTGTSSNSSQSSSFRTTTTFLSAYGDSSSCLFQSSNSSATSRLINGPDEAEDVVQVGIF